MVLQRQCNLKQWNNAMTDCISLIELVSFLNQTIYKPGPFCRKSQNKSFFFSCIQNHNVRPICSVFSFLVLTEYSLLLGGKKNN